MLKTDKTIIGRRNNANARTNARREVDYVSFLITIFNRSYYDHS